MKPSHKKKWLQVIEFAVMGLATWLNPNATFLIFLLQRCFQILVALQKDEQSQTDKGERTSPHLHDR